jgi:hypothetical protein
LNKQLLHGRAFLDAYEAQCLDSTGQGIPAEQVPAWIYQHPSESLWVRVMYRRGWVVDVYEHKLINRDNWWRFMLRD